MGNNALSCLVNSNLLIAEITPGSTPNVILKYEAPVQLNSSSQLFSFEDKLCVVGGEKQDEVTIYYFSPPEEGVLTHGEWTVSRLIFFIGLIQVYSK